MDRLLALLLAINPEGLVSHAPDPGPDEVVVGVLTDNLKRLWFLLRQAEGRYADLSKRLVTTGDSDERKLLADETRIAEAMRANYSNLFWASATVEFPDLLDQLVIGVRSEFRLVYRDESVHQPRKALQFEPRELVSAADLVEVRDIFAKD